MDRNTQLGGRLTPEGFRRSYPIQTATIEIGPLLANIEHFLSDGDIRARDPRYKTMQEAAIERMITALRAGDVDAARGISLLRS